MAIKSELIKKVFYMGLFIVLGSCSKSDSSSQILTISTTKMGFILPGKAYPTCYVTGTIFDEPRFTINRITTTWKGEGTFEPVAVRVEIPESGNLGKQNCTVAGGDEQGALALFLGFTSSPVGTGADVPVTVDSNCQIHCGSLNVKNPKASFNATVTVKLIGIQTIGDSQTPVSATTTFTLKNIP